MQWTRDEFILTNEAPNGCFKATFDLLQTTYWSHKRPMPVVEKIIDHSFCFFLLSGDRQIGFARVISDFVTTSWVADVVLNESFRGQGLGKWMMECLLDHPDVRETQFVLQTGSAHKFYERLGFARKDTMMGTAVDYL